jgi:hypothetical protein
MITCTFNPKTHKVVPIESTSKMDQAGEKVLENAGEREEAVPCWDAMIAAAPEYPADTGWISVDERLPSIGQIVDLCINGIVQNETYSLDEGDTSDYAPSVYFWSRDDIDEGIDIESGQYWKDRPLPPAPEAVC